MISHEERKLYYDKDYFDTDKKPPYREWWWSDPAVWSPRAKALHRDICGIAIKNRWQIFFDNGLKQIGQDGENIEHPSVIGRDEIVSYFGDFIEFEPMVYIYDILMGTTFHEVEPVLPFYNTIFLRRK